jgi:hypothetical protein
MTTNLAISRILPAQRGSPMTDNEFTADYARRPHLMKEMLRDRGYSRNQHGFWVAPGSRMTAAKVETVEKTINEHNLARDCSRPRRCFALLL